jgi:serine protease
MRQAWLVAALAAISAPAFAQDLVPGKILLDFKDEVTQAEVEAFGAEYGIKARLNSIYSADEELYLAEVDPSREAALLERMKGDPRLEQAEPLAYYTLPQGEATPVFDNGEVTPQAFPNDPKYKHQWHLDQIQMPKAWADGASGAGVIVAVIDTGVAYEDYQRFKRVPDLAETKFVAGYDFVNDTAHANDDHGHGTHVAGTIAQSTNNGIGVAGVAYKAAIMPIKVLSAEGGGTTADIADGIRFAADHGAKVINMSLGGPFPSGVMRDAVVYARKKGVTVVAAAGNNGWNKVGYPAAYEGVVAVSATDFEDKLTFYSNYGKDIDIAAPGGDTRSDKNGDGIPDGVLQNTIAIGDPSQNGYYPYMGTSMASPHVAGVAALIIAAGVTKPDDVEKVLFETADRAPAERAGAKKGEKWDEKFGFGRVDAAAAVKAAQDVPNGYRVSFALALAGLVLVALRRKNSLERRPGGLFGLGLLSGAAGPLFFLPWLGVSLGAVTGFFAQGLPSWDMGLLGVAWHGNLLFFSAALPLVAVALLGKGRGRDLAAGLALGVAAHLGYATLFGGFDIALLPGVALDKIWLALNAAFAGLLGYLSLKKS